MKNQDLVESFSGIRGIYGKSITEDLARKYAAAYCCLRGDKISTLLIGGDSRSSTPVLKKAIIESFKNWGIKRIIDVGIVPLQVCECSILKFKASGGIYISASHNEPEYNGFKFLKKDGSLLYPKDIDNLIKKVHSINRLKLKKIKETKKTRVINKRKEAIREYLNYVLEKLSEDVIKKIRKAKFKILVDSNGGTAIIVLDKLFKMLGVNAKFINKKLGCFKRLIEPNAESLKYLQKRIDKEEFDFGCGFDCDADRVEIVISSFSKFAKESGTVVSGNYILALSCDSYLKGTKNQTVVTNDCTSYLVRDVIKKYSAQVKEVEVGEMNVVSEMEKQNSIIGGEGSCGGVIVFPLKCRDGIMSIILILKMLAEKRESLANILKNYPKYYSERTEINCSSDEAIGIKNKLENYFKSQGFKIKKTGGISGGLKILFNKNSYLWFRQSKTEAGVFRIISDGDNSKKVAQMLKKGIILFNNLDKI